MGLYHVTSTGTRTSGESTPGDWSDANCYVGVTATVGQWEVLPAINEVVIGNGQTITETSGVLAFPTTNKSAIIRGESAAQRPTWQINHATNPLLLMQNSTDPFDVSLRALRVRRAVATGAATEPLVKIGGNTFANALGGALDDVIFGPFDISTDFTATSTPPVLQFHGNSATHIVCRNVSFEGINYLGARFGYVRCRGTGRTYEWIGGTWSDCHPVAAINLPGGWGWSMEDGVTVTLRNIRVRDCTVNAATELNCGAWYRHTSGTITTIVDDVRFERVVAGSPGAPVGTYGWGFMIVGPHRIRGVHSVDCEWHFSANVDGGQLQFREATAVQLAPTEDISVRRCRGGSGLGMFTSFGATPGGVYRRLQAYDCVGRLGMFYSGRFEDATFETFVISGCTSSIASPGIAIYARNNTEVRNKDVKVRNGVVYGCSSGVVVANATTGFDITADVANVLLVDIDDTYDVRAALSDSGVALPVLTVRNCHTPNGVLNADAESGELVDAPVFTDPDRDDFSLRPGSPGRGAGLWIPGVRALDDLAMPLNPDIGPWQDRGAPGRQSGVSE
jgi:hypothetical protein